LRHPPSSGTIPMRLMGRNMGRKVWRKDAPAHQ
jgi:hypothetical protein